MKSHPMFTVLSIVALLWSQVASGGSVDDHFTNGALDLMWGATLEQVQSKYPNGRTWPTDQSDGWWFVYETTMDVALLGIEKQAVNVMFYFNERVRLGGVSVHFDYEDRDAILYAVARALGQDYSVRNEKTSSNFGWKGGDTTVVRLNIGSAPPYSWAILGIRKIAK